MASDNLSGNEQMVELITQQTCDFLAALKNDISKCKASSEDDRKNCEAICQRASIEYNRFKMQFLRETLILIDKALNTSNEKDLGEIHLAWSLQLDQVTHQCEHIANPLIDVARILSKSDERMGKKYWYCLGSAMVSFLLIGTAYGFFIAYYFPTSLVSMLGKSVFVMGASAFAVSGIAANYKKIPALNCNGCTNESPRLMAPKSTQNYSNDQKDDTPASELAMKMKQSITTLNITEDMWHNRENLKSIKEVAEAQLRNCENST